MKALVSVLAVAVVSTPAFSQKSTVPLTIVGATSPAAAKSATTPAPAAQPAAAPAAPVTTAAAPPTARPAAAPQAAVPGPAQPNLPKPRIFVTESDSWQMHGGQGGTAAGFGGGFSGGASPQTAEIIKTFSQRCPDVIVNSRSDASDYVVRLEHEGGKGLLRKKDKVVVFVQKTGDSIFSNSTLSVGGSVEGACEAISTHWQANATSLAAAPAPSAAPAPVAAPAAGAASMASLTVESSVAGADIEIDGNFVGSTPSTVTVAPGQHTIVVKKKGHQAWSRTMNVSGSSVHVNADLEVAP